MKTINIGLIGTGFMGKGHSLAYRIMPMVFNPAPALPRLAIVADVSEELASRAARDFGFERWAVGWEAVVNDPAVDVVDITTPNHLHKDIAIAAAQAGKHIYCEKPLALTAADAKAMVAAADAARVKTMVGFNYIQNPAAQLAKHLIDSGELGQIYHFRGTFLQDALADPNAPFSWRFDKRIAGAAGVLGDLGAHVIQYARYLLGDFNEVIGLSRTFITERPEASGPFGYDKGSFSGRKRTVENEDANAILISFKSGATGIIESSRIATGRKVYLSIEVNGSQGSLYFNHERMNELKVYLASDPPNRQGFRTILIGPDHPPYGHFWPVAGLGLGYEDLKVIEVHALLDGIANDKPLYPDFHEGWKVCQITDAVLASVAERRWTKVDAY